MSVIGSIEATHELCANLDNLIELTKESRAPIRALSFIERAREDGVSACLRDLGRFGLLALEDGAAFGGRQVLPSGWRDLIGQPDSAPTGFGRLTPGSPMGYGYHWWAMPHGPTGIHAGAFLAAGSFGQYVYVHPTERVVAAVQSTWRHHEDPDANAGTWALLGAALRELRPDPA
jgi:CubicO group peptidase (beta-lactamase class C family)